MKRFPRSVAVFLKSAFFLIIASPLLAGTLESFQSLEDPRFDPARAVMNVGQDGRVYFTSSIGRPGYVLAMDRDGSNRTDGDTVYALRQVTANADGLIATANAHFSHSVNVYSPDFGHLASNDSFTNGDHVHDWNAPGKIEAGPSGDFYALDHNVFRVVRLNHQARIVGVISLPDSGAFKYADMKLDEPRQRLALSDERTLIRVVDFDGNTLADMRTVGNTWFDFDERGVLHVIESDASQVRRFELRQSPDNDTGYTLVELDPLTLQSGAYAASREMPFRNIKLFENDLVLQRRHPTELFTVYDARTGEWKRTVNSNARTKTIKRLRLEA